MKNIITIIVGVALLLTALPLIQAQAGGPPYTIKTQIDETYSITDLCPFEVTAKVNGVMTTRYYFDRDWTPVRSLDNYRVKWTYSANGITLHARTGGPSHVNFISENEVELRYAGAYTLVTAKGKGVVFGSAGQGYESYQYNPETEDFDMVDSTFKSGLYAFWNVDQFCAALNP